MKISRYTYHDTLNFISKLNIEKVNNATKVLLSYYISRVFKNTKISGKPITISFEPTTSCNLRCPECPSGLRAFTRPIGNLEKDFFIRTIDDLYRKLIYLIFYFQGEPYLNPDFLEMVRYANEKNIYTITSTNGHFLNDENAKKTVESGLNRLIISLDGTTDEVYTQYRIGGKLDKVIEGTKNILKWKKIMKSKKPYVVFQFLVVKPNEHQIEDVRQLAKELGVDNVFFKSAQIYDYKHGNPLIPTIDKYSRYKKNQDGTYDIKNGLTRSCWKMWHSNVITWDGKIVPCCFDKDAEFILGDLKISNFDDIWNGRKYSDFRFQITQSRDKIDMCRNCSEGTRVWL